MSDTGQEPVADAPEATPEVPMTGRQAAIETLRAAAKVDSGDGDETAGETTPAVAAPATAPAAESPAATPDTPDTKAAQQWAVINRRVRDLERREAAAKKAEADIDAGRKLIERAKANPIEFVDEHVGGTKWHEDLIKRYATGDGAPTVEEHITKLQQRLDAEIAGRDKLVQDAIDRKLAVVKEEQEGAAQARTYLSQVDKLLQEDRFELTRLHPRGKAEVVRLVQQAFAQTQKVLTAEQALTMIESEIEAEHKALAQSKRFGSTAQTTQGEAEQKQKSSPQQRPNGSGPRAVTNKLTAEPAPPREGPVSDAERKRRAVEVLRRARQQP